MTKKQKLKKFLNSVVKSHGDIEEDKNEIEKNVKKMLDFFENNHAYVSDKSDLVSLVNDIKGRYHALYGRHDGLMGKIRNKVRHKKGESTSELSDSCSDDSSDNDGPDSGQDGKYMASITLEDSQSVLEQLHGLSRKNAELEAQVELLQAKLKEQEHLANVLAEKEPVIVELENKLQATRESLESSLAENEFLKIEIEKLKEQEGSLHTSIRCLHEEKEVLMLETEKYSVMLLEREKSMLESKTELGRIKEETVKLSDENIFLREELEKTAQEVLHLNQQLIAAREVQESVQSAKQELELVKESLISENARILSENLDLKVQQEVAATEIANKNQSLLMMEEEIDSLKSEAHRLSTIIHETDKTVNDITIQSGLLKEEVAELNATIDDLNLKVKVKDEELHAMTLESSEASKIVQQADERIMMLSGEIERIKSENSLLLIGNENTKSLLESNNQELSRLKHASEAIECERNSLIEEKTALVSAINDGRVIIDGLKARIERLESENSEFQVKVSNLTLELQAVRRELTDVNGTLMAAEEERMTLNSENSLLSSKLQETEFNAERLQTQLQELNENNFNLLNKIKGAEKTTAYLESERDGLIGNNAQLEIKVKELITEQEMRYVQLNKLEILIHSAEEERTNFISEMSTLTRKLEHAEVQIKKQKGEIDLLSQENTVLQKNQQELSYKWIDRKKGLEDALIEMQHLKDTMELALKEASYEFQLIVDEFKRDIDDMFMEKNDLVQRIKTLSVISSENQASIRQMEDYIRGKVSALVSEINDGRVIIERLESENSEFQLKVSNLTLELQAVRRQLTDANGTLMAAEEERISLNSENSLLSSKLQEAEFNAERLQTQLQELNENNFILLNKIKGAEKTTAYLESERDGLIANNAQLEIKVKELMTEQEKRYVQLNKLEILIHSAEEEKTNFISEISTLTRKLEHAEVQIKKEKGERDLLSQENTVLQKNQQELSYKWIDHEKGLEDALTEMQHLKDTMELALKEASHEFQLIVDEFKRDIDDMFMEKNDLVQRIKTLSVISSENEASMRQMEDYLRGKFSDHEALLKKYEELLFEHKQLETKLDTAEKKLEEMGNKEEIIQKLDTICTNQIKEIGMLDERYKGLLEKLSFTEIGVTDAEKEIERLEVLLRLSNQKLKVTETECKEKEENYKRLIAGLDKQVLALSGSSSILNKECRQIKLGLDSVMKSLNNELQELESTAKENTKNIINQLAECQLELQNVKMKVGSDSHIRKTLENEKHELESRLQYNEEIFSKLKDEASFDREKLVEREKRLQILEARLTESDKKLREKEKEVLEKDEEKREAIRQLCLQIEYHWDNCNHLLKCLSALQRRQH
ncbi:hypothetical protein AXF42_Ash014580 [Apostasia shenzhenica]|uniref:NAB domain-containing protein n=1 Tax=Apostasia shenzhenica TaxID=1088818 RepID=A0A2I0AK28_9ASPA|nr:hypothetical protein AXF42_Ash014580 [Apostasia shenzhenica]